MDPDFLKLGIAGFICVILWVMLIKSEKREEKKMAIDKRDFYADPRDNPIRRELCNFLILKGEEDHFQEVRMWSNYQLELSAKAKGWTGSEESQ